ncbi:MAG: M36 family metallopeptidase [Bacteroidota bacterium]
MRSTFLRFLIFSGMIGIGALFGQQTELHLLQYLQKQHKQFGLTAQDVQSPVITDQYSSVHNGVQHIFFQQAVGGLRVHKAVGNANYDRDGRLLSLHQAFQLDAHSRMNTSSPSISASQAVQAAMQELGISLAGNFPVGQASHDLDQTTVFKSFEMSQHPIVAKLMYFPTDAGEIRLSWSFDVYEVSGEDWWDLWIDAVNGQILSKTSRALRCDFGEACEATHSHKTAPQSVRKFPLVPTPRMMMTPQYNALSLGIESPDHGSVSLLTDPSDPVASQFGWHDTDGQTGAEYTITRGNNVFAKEDLGGSNGPGYSPDGGMNLDFNFPVDFTLPLNSYRDASVVNLFVWNNFMHDVWYRYGFDEVSGNFQDNNYGKGGQGGDFVNADGRDGSGEDNAVFFITPDGTNPRMEMFLWNPGFTGGLAINSPSTIMGDYSFSQALFGPGLPTTPITEDIVLVQDGSGNNEGCSALTNGTDLNGKIALVDRGNCPFVQKVRNAQAAGAVAVVVVNNVGGAPIPLGISPNDPANDVVIPSVMISMANGQTIKAELSDTVNATLSLPTPVAGTDGSFDNGVVSHEYGHGISTRLTGGPSNAGCYQNDEQAGEGFSDFFGLVMSTDSTRTGTEARPIGTHVQNQLPSGSGIRSFPYSTDLSIHPQTYDDIKNKIFNTPFGQFVSPHGVGEIMCATIWDLYWRLVDEYGFDSDMYTGTGGNNLAMQLVIDGLKLQPCGAGFLDYRDAVLLADQTNNGGANECLIWEVFARRGMGASADQGSPNDVEDGTEAFDMPSSCLNSLKLEKLVDKTEAKAGDTLTYTLNIINETDSTLTNVVVKDTLPDNVSYVAGSANCGGIESAGILQLQLGTLAPAQVNVCTFQVTINDSSAYSMVVFEDNLDSMQNTYVSTSLTGTDAWRLDTINPRSGTHAFYVPNRPADNDQLLQLPAQTIDANTIFSFWHSFDTESAWDGGFVEIFNPAIGDWDDLGPFMIQNGYNNIVGSNNPAGERDVFGGNSNGYIQTKIDLGSFDGLTTAIRFRFVSDNNTFEDGWYLDDFFFGLEVNTINRACVEAAEGNIYCAEQDRPTLILEPEPDTSTTAIETLIQPLSLMIYPNPTSHSVTIEWEQALQGQARVRLFAPNGQLLETRTLSRLGAGERTQISLDSYATGIYLLEVSSKEGINRYKVMKE